MLIFHPLGEILKMKLINFKSMVRPREALVLLMLLCNLRGPDQTRPALHSPATRPRPSSTARRMRRGSSGDCRPSVRFCPSVPQTWSFSTQGLRFKRYRPTDVNIPWRFYSLHSHLIQCLKGLLFQLSTRGMVSLAFLWHVS